MTADTLTFVTLSLAVVVILVGLIDAARGIQ